MASRMKSSKFAPDPSTTPVDYCPSSGLLASRLYCTFFRYFVDRSAAVLTYAFARSISCHKMRKNWSQYLTVWTASISTTLPQRSDLALVSFLCIWTVWHCVSTNYLQQLPKSTHGVLQNTFEEDRLSFCVWIIHGWRRSSEAFRGACAGLTVSSSHARTGNPIALLFMVTMRLT